MDSLSGPILSIRKKVERLCGFLQRLPSLPATIDDIDSCLADINTSIEAIHKKISCSFDPDDHDDCSMRSYFHDIVYPGLLALRYVMAGLASELAKLDVAYEVYLEHLNRYLLMSVDFPVDGFIRQSGHSLVSSIEKTIDHFVYEPGTVGVFEVHGPPSVLYAYECSHIQAIVTEAIVNSRKHSRAAQIHVRISFDVDGLAIRLKDSGCGFDIEATTTGNGLVNMRKRANLIQGHLKIDTGPGTGCCVSLSVPRKGVSLGPNERA